MWCRNLLRPNHHALFQRADSDKAMTRAPAPLAAWPLAARAGLVGVMTDIDDTLTTDGTITSDALQALHQLKSLGLAVVAITGRPVGWSEPYVGAWPLDAIVAENGAVALIPENENSLQRSNYNSSKLSKIYRQDASTRSAHFTRMQAVLAQIERDVPGARRATDSAGRETDIAIDHSEFTQLGPAQITAVVQQMQQAGMHATVSSIHINGWFGEHNKLQGARWIVQTLWQRNLDAELGQWAYIGDSTNDQLMFETLPHSIGVANVRRFMAQLNHFPRYVTPGERGAGFAQMAQAVIEARAGTAAVSLLRG